MVQASSLSAFCVDKNSVSGSLSRERVAARTTSFLQQEGIGMANRKSSWVPLLGAVLILFVVASVGPARDTKTSGLEAETVEPISKVGEVFGGCAHSAEWFPGCYPALATLAGIERRDPWRPPT
jgi:hypothetical protein